MRTAGIVLAACLALASVVLVAPPAGAMPECDALHGPCPGVVCIGSGDQWGYKACIGPGYCDPAACDEVLP